jgi:hypothetical protein
VVKGEGMGSGSLLGRACSCVGGSHHFLPPLGTCQEDPPFILDPLRPRDKMSPSLPHLPLLLLTLDTALGHINKWVYVGGGHLD